MHMVSQFILRREQDASSPDPYRRQELQQMGNFRTEFQSWNNTRMVGSEKQSSLSFPDKILPSFSKKPQKLNNSSSFSLRNGNKSINNSSTLFLHRIMVDVPCLCPSFPSWHRDGIHGVAEYLSPLGAAPSSVMKVWMEIEQPVNLGLLHDSESGTHGTELAVLTRWLRTPSSYAGTLLVTTE